MEPGQGRTFDLRPEPDPHPLHFLRYIRDIAGRDRRDTRYMRDKCWLFAASQHTFAGQAADPPAVSFRVSVLNAPQEATGR